MAELTITLPKPHKAQRSVLESSKRFNVVRCGRRWGKTAMGVLLVAGLGRLSKCEAVSRGVLSGHPVCWVAPTYKYLTEAWRDVRRVLKPLETRVSTVDRRIEYATGGVLEFWSADRGDVARSRKYALVVIDEAAIIPDLMNEWQESIMPALADFSGGAYFLSTPKGDNDFKKLDEIAADDKTGLWARHHYPTWTNPYIKQQEIELLRQTMDRLSFMQEIEAEFVAAEGVLMRPEYLQRGTPQGELLATAVGVDLAISKTDYADYTAIVKASAYRLQDGMIGYRIDAAERGRWNFGEAMERIKLFWERHRPNAIAVEDVAYQKAAVETLQKAGLPVEAVRPVKDKVARFNQLLAAYEHGRVWHNEKLPDWFERELLVFPTGEHDDCVDAAVYAVHTLPSVSTIQIG